MKLGHHIKMEPECENEKISLILLIKRFKEFLFNVDKKIKVKCESGSESAVYSSLKKTFQDAQHKLIEYDFFSSVLGQNFDEACLDDNKLNDIIVKLKAKEN